MEIEASLVGLKLETAAMLFSSDNLSYFLCNPNHNYCMAQTGYLADKAGPLAPDTGSSILGS